MKTEERKLKVTLSIISKVVINNKLSREGSNPIKFNEFKKKSFTPSVLSTVDLIKRESKGIKEITLRFSKIPAMACKITTSDIAKYLFFFLSEIILSKSKYLSKLNVFFILPFLTCLLFLPKYQRKWYYEITTAKKTLIILPTLLS